MSLKKISLSDFKQSFKVEVVPVTEMAFFQLASLFVEFERFEIEKLVQANKQAFAKGTYIYKFDLDQAFQDYAIPTPKGEKYTIDTFLRNKILRSITDSEVLISLLKLFPRKQKFGTTQRLFIESLENGSLGDLDGKNMSELLAIREIARWLKGTRIKVPDPEQISYYIEKEELLASFKKITKNFQGRKRKLNDISDYVNWLPGSNVLQRGINTFREIVDWHEKPPLLITGIGGIGKSTLVAKFILDHVDANRIGLPFIYLDFDNGGLSVADPFSLIPEALRQLSLQFPEHRGALDNTRKNLSDRNGNQSGRPISMRDVENFLQNNQEYFSALDRPILMVLDSFEEVQYKASPTEINQFFKFLERISRLIPRFRPIIVGRSEVHLSPSDFEFSFETIYLDEFDLESAVGYLESLNVKSRDLRQLIAKKFGGNPLTLKLAANVVLKEGEDDKLIFDNVKTKNLFLKIDERRIQGHLVQRNLDHVHNEDVKKLAVPGMLVRRVSPEIIKEVLAEPCGLGDIDIESATKIYQELLKESFLIQRVESIEFTFRTDLRMALVDIIKIDYKKKVEKIHKNAIKFYEGKEEVQNRAELLYHSILSGKEIDVIDRLYTSDMRPFIDNSLTEFPLNEYVHLAVKMGISVSKTILDKASEDEWEAYVKTRVMDVLESGDIHQLLEIRSQIEERDQRSNSDLYYYHVKLCQRLNDYKGGLGIIRQWQDAIRKSKRSNAKIDLARAILFENNFEFSEAFRVVRGINLQSKQLDLNDRITGMISKKRLMRRVEDRKTTWVEDTDLLLLKKLPKPYQASLLKLENYFLSKRDFFEVYYPCEKIFRSNKDLDHFLVQNFNLNLRQVSETGTIEVNVIDFIKFVEVQFKGNLEEIKNCLFSDQNKFQK